MLSFNLPEELVILIMIRLPVKSLLQFKCVSKSWYALIKNPRFASDHFRFHSNNNRNETILKSHVDHIKVVLSLGSYQTPDEFTSINPYYLPQSIKSGFDYRMKVNEPPPPISERGFDHRGLNLLGPINGILCIFFKHGFDIILWNPATRDSIALPPFIQPSNWKSTLYGIGFGFDSQRTNDYKVVRIVMYSINGVKHTHIEVCSPTNGSWREITPIFPFPSLDYISYDCTYFNGACQWWTLWSDDANHCKSILSFDMADEVFYNISVPDALDKDHNVFKPEHLGVINESIALVTNINNTIDVWVMKEYGIKESWAKLFVIKLPEGMRWSVGLPMFGKLLMQDSSLQSAWHDLNTREIKYLRSFGASYSIHLISYIESLFSIKGVIIHEQ